MTRKPIGVTSPYRKIGCVQHDCERCQRGWVGLTDEEKLELWEVSRAALPRYATYASLVEARLKEKNT